MSAGRSRLPTTTPARGTAGPRAVRSNPASRTGESVQHAAEHSPLQAHVHLQQCTAVTRQTGGFAAALDLAAAAPSVGGGASRSPTVPCKPPIAQQHHYILAFDMQSLELYGIWQLPWRILEIWRSLRNQGHAPELGILPNFPTPLLDLESRARGWSRHALNHSPKPVHANGQFGQHGHCPSHFKHAASVKALGQASLAVSEGLGSDEVGRGLDARSLRRRMHPDGPWNRLH